MSILIPGVSLPPDDKMDLVLCIRHDGTVFSPWGTVLGKAIELPPNGRLIDADKLCKSFQAQTEIIRKWGIDELTEIADLLEKGFLQEVENAETIIPADQDGGAD